MRRHFRSRWSLALAVGAMLMVALTLYGWFARTGAGTPIPASGGEAMNLPPFAGQLYLQTDARWKDDRLGGSGEGFGATGCVVCCISMALAHHGIDIPPGRLNARLDSMGGFTPEGWVKWTSVSELTSNRITIEAPSNPEHMMIDESLKVGNPVLAKVLLRNSVPHWVLIVGKEGYHYLMNDPLGDGSGAERLDRYKSPVHTIRVVRRSG